MDGAKRLLDAAGLTRVFTLAAPNAIPNSNNAVFVERGREGLPVTAIPLRYSPRVDRQWLSGDHRGMGVWLICRDMTMSCSFSIFVTVFGLSIPDGFTWISYSWQLH